MKVHKKNVRQVNRMRNGACVAPGRIVGTKENVVGPTGIYLNRCDLRKRLIELMSMV